MKYRHACVHRADHLMLETSHRPSEMVLIAHRYTKAPSYAFQITVGQGCVWGGDSWNFSIFLICPTHLREGVISLLNLPYVLDLWSAEVDNRWNVFGLIVVRQPICQCWRISGLVPEFLRVSSECLDSYFIHQAFSLKILNSGSISLSDRIRRRGPRSKGRGDSTR